MIREIMLVPLPRAASRRLMSFLTFHISICDGFALSAGPSPTKKPVGRFASTGSQVGTHILLGLAGLRVAHFRCGD